MKKVFEPMTDVIKNTSQDLTKTITESSIKDNKTISDLNEKVLKLLNNNVMMAPYLSSSLVNLVNPENKNQFKLIKDPKSIGMKSFMTTMTNYKFNAAHSNPQDQKLVYEFGKELNFDIKQEGRKSPRDRFIIKNSPAIMASGNSTVFLPSDPNEVCDRLKLLFQEKQAGSNSNTIDGEVIAKADNLFEYKCISINQHRQFF